MITCIKPSIGVCLIVLLFFQSQTTIYSIPQIGTLLSNETCKLRINGKFKEVILLNEQLIHISKRLNYGMLKSMLYGEYGRNYHANRIEKHTVKIFAHKFLKHKDSDERWYKNAFVLLILIVIFSIVIIGFLAYRLFNIKKLDELEFNQEKEKIKVENEEENNKLKQRFNVEVFDEVIHLAKYNDSAFLARFQDTYPFVCEKLLLINPKLVNSELRLAAMIWLNFSTKDIAQYTFVQPKTVQIKKYRLRKKLKISFSENIYVFLRSI